MAENQSKVEKFLDGLKIWNLYHNESLKDVDVTQYRYKAELSKEEYFDLPENRHPGVVYKIVNAYDYQNDFELIPAIFLNLWSKGYIEIFAEDKADYLEGFLHLSFKLTDKDRSNLPECDVEILKVLELCKQDGKETINCKDIDDCYRKQTQKVELELNGINYCLSEEAKTFVEVFKLPIEEGDNKGFSKEVKIFLAIAIVVCIGLGVINPVFFIASLVPIYLLLVRKDSPEAKRLTQKGENILAEWRKFLSFVDNKDGIYTEEIKKLSSEDIKRFIPYLFIFGKMDEFMEKLPQVNENLTKGELDIFYKDGDYSLTINHFLFQFKRAAQFVYTISRNSRMNFSFSDKIYD